MKRRIMIILVVVICFLLQGTLFQTLSLSSISPNLLIIITSSVGFMNGRREGMWVGFFCGILEDIFYGQLFGMHALLYLYIGYANGFFNRIFYREDVKLPIFLVSASDLAYGLGTYVLLFAMRSRLDFGYYFMSIILPELVYTIFITLIFYRFIYSIDRSMKNDPDA